MAFETFTLFFITTVLVVLAPGAAAVAAASQGASNGALKSIAGAAGIASANVVYFALSATGIAALIVASHTVFSIIKWVGVAYLIYLGLMALLSKSGGLVVKSGKPRTVYSLYLQGFIIEFANPKALLYFAAILPLFIDVDRPLIWQLLIMGGVTLCIDLAIYAAYGLLGDRLTRGTMPGWIIATVNKTAGTALLYAGYKMSRITAS
ncbi:Threonine/homoserine/homoserine lactone efflux protein [Octadecabacter temperatus]|uniref:Homoserine/homoserine lactone efflux protein n=1 Tax=Octadecabacter temperatus TaxID=1458307 RepID=A0A0K0Y6F4_9RHOB|nr:LysE family translocator [Octadecabacter temperatus]AKS46549.1 Homoserine/homoserine lactone efflux protein [Octadecabacter temperatus]SIO16387.1 Threonine/homoserine/homoserine lactone efflux protein [Octadecabacter temperatus]